MTKLSSLSVFFPAYNEAANLPQLLKKAQQIIPKLATRYELIVINDGSTDQTVELVNQLRQDNPRIKLVSHPTNRGYGAALRSGFAHSQFDWVFFTDADLQFDLQELSTFLPATEHADVILGYRTKRAEGFGRARNAYLFKVFVDALFRVHVRDIDCAFKLIKASHLKNLKLESNGAFISAELLYKLKKNRVKFMQLPVSHYPRRFGQPTGANWRVIVRAGTEALRLYFHVKLGRLKQHQW